MYTAGVVADHTAKRAAAVRGRIRRVGQAMMFGGLAYAIQHNARLNTRTFACGVKIKNAINIF